MQTGWPWRHRTQDQYGGFDRNEGGTARNLPQALQRRQTATAHSSVRARSSTHRDALPASPLRLPRGVLSDECELVSAPSTPHSDVVVASCRDQLACVSQTMEQVFVEPAALNVRLLRQRTDQPQRAGVSEEKVKYSPCHYPSAQADRSAGKACPGRTGC